MSLPRYGCWGLALLLLGLVSAQAHAAGLLHKNAIPEVLTPARLRQPQSEVPASVTIIDRELIEASGAREIYDVLKLVPGMNAALVHGNTPTVNYHASQATDSRRLLVLIDGRSVYQAGLARVEWNDLPITLADVERIEVTRGPASAAYGPNAFLGVINIITRDPRDQLGTQIFTRQGNHGVNDWRLVHAQTHGSDASWRLSLSSQADAGYDKQQPGLVTPHNSKRADKANATLYWWLDDNDKLTLRAGASQTRLDISQNSAIATWSRPQRLPWEDHQRSFLQFDWQHQASRHHRWQGNIYIQHVRELANNPVCTKAPLSGLPVESGNLIFTAEMHELYLASGSDLNATLAATAALTQPALWATLTSAQQLALQKMQGRLMTMLGKGALCGNMTLDIETQRVAAQLQDTLQWGPLRLVTGLALHEDRGHSDVYLNGTRVNRSLSLFSDMEWRLLDSWLINAGGYAEYDQENGDYFSPRIANIFKLSPGQSIRFVYAEAVRSMDMYENHADVRLRLHNVNAPYNQNSQALLGQAQPWLFISHKAANDLSAERIRSRSVGYYSHTQSVDLDVHWFYEQLWNLVSQPINVVRFDANNSGSMHNYGWEAQLGWRPNERQLWRATFTHIASHATASAEQAFVAANSGSLLWRYDVAPHWMFSAVWYAAQDWSGYPFARYDASLAHDIGLGHTRLRLSATMRWRNNEPVIYASNRYQNNRAFWLTANLSF